MHACIHAYMNACTHTDIRTCRHAYIHTCMHAYIKSADMHACIHTYMHAYTCTHNTYNAHTLIPLSLSLSLSQYHRHPLKAANRCLRPGVAYATTPSPPFPECPGASLCMHLASLAVLRRGRPRSPSRRRHSRCWRRDWRVMLQTGRFGG